MADVLPLLRRHPALERLARRPFVETPTPVEPLALPGVPDGALFVKRDERVCPLYGGNKPRKLEFVIGEALARGARRLVTTGALGTHHGLATTLLGRAAGLATTVVVVPQPVSDHVREQVALMAAHGAELVYAPNAAAAGLRIARAWLAAWARGERPMWVSIGGSSPLGCVGFVSAAFELAEQVQAGALPAPREIYVAAGSGGTLAGLLLGLRLAGVTARPIGVVVTRFPPVTKGRIVRLARATLARLRRLDPELPALRIGTDDFELGTDQIGAGYGAPTARGRAAEAAARRAGLELEGTYTAKCLAEVLERFASGRARPPALFWNTFNGIDVRGRTPALAAPASLPASLRRALAAGTP